MPIEYPNGREQAEQLVELGDEDEFGEPMAVVAFGEALPIMPGYDIKERRDALRIAVARWIDERKLP